MRNKAIDIMKGILTIMMISCHLLYQTVQNPGLFNEYVNLTTFSGFLFCFGFVAYVAYFQKYDIPPVKKLIIGGVKTLFAYYASAFMLIFMLTSDHSFETLLNYLCQKRIASYAEFLLSWAYLYFIILLLFPVLKKVIGNSIFMVLVIIMSLAATFIPYEQLTIPWIGPIIGMGYLDYFPLIQYISYFLIGAYMSKHKIVYSKYILIFALITNVLFINYLYQNGHFPRRWGVSLCWIIGGYLYVYIYYILSHMMEENIISHVLEFIGKNTLIILVCSDFFVFIGLKYNFVSLNVNKYFFYVIYWIITVGVCMFVAFLKNSLERRLARNKIN